MTDDFENDRDRIEELIVAIDDFMYTFESEYGSKFDEQRELLFNVKEQIQTKISEVENEMEAKDEQSNL